MHAQRALETRNLPQGGVMNTLIRLAAACQFSEAAAAALAKAVARHFNLVDGTLDVGGLQEELAEQAGVVTAAQLACVLSRPDAWKAIHDDLRALFPGARELCQADLPQLPAAEAQAIIGALCQAACISSIRIQQYNLDFSRIQPRAGARPVKVLVKCRANVQGLFILPPWPAVELHPLPNREVPGVTVGQLAPDGSIAASYAFGSFEAENLRALALVN